MTELDFTMELNSDGLSDQVEKDMFVEADTRLRDLAEDHSDLRGAAVNIRRPAKAETNFIYEVTVAVYARPKQIAATQKDSDPLTALNDALDAVERQIREKRAKMGKHWEQPGNDPITKEIMETIASENLE